MGFHRLVVRHFSGGFPVGTKRSAKRTKRDKATDHNNVTNGNGTLK
jgi:hypothetical protein